MCRYKYNSMTPRAILCILVLVVASATFAKGGPLAYGICQTGCNAVAVACYTAGGGTFGVVAPPSIVGVIAGCNAALGFCMASCVAAGLLPTP